MGIIEQDVGAMLKRGKNINKHSEQAKGAEESCVEPYPPNFVESLPDGDANSSIVIYRIHGFKTHARDQMADHIISTIPLLYVDQDRVEKIAAVCM